MIRYDPRLLLRVWCRYTDKPSTKPRPPWFTKQTCLSSLLESLEQVTEHLASLTVVVDGPVSHDLRDLLDGRARMVTSSRGGKCRTFGEVLRIAIAESAPGEIVYFAEDDYLYAPDAFAALLEAAREMNDVDYFTLYDHPDRYSGAERAFSRTTVGARSWYGVPSTCLTFAARIEALRRDRWLFYAASRTPGLDSRVLRQAAVRAGWRTPMDELSWHLVLRERQRKPWSRPMQRRLLSPVPGLATHCESGVVSEGVDWERIALNSRR